MNGFVKQKYVYQQKPMISNDYKIFSIIVAYNPNIDEFISTVKQLKQQTSCVVICNNSEFEINLNEYGVKCFNFGRNIGIAQAQCIGMRWAFDQGAEFVFQIDQDSILSQDIVRKLKESFDEASKLGYKVGVIGPRHYDKVTGEVERAIMRKGRIVPGTNLEIVSAVISSGSLIPKISYETAGTMEGPLFIDAVDLEYCWRLKTFSLLSVRDNTCSLGHRIGKGTKRVFNIKIKVPSPERHYYHIRNLFLLMPRKYVPFSWKILGFSKFIFKTIFYPFIFTDGKSRCMLMLKGAKDGVFRKYGK